MFVEPFLMLVLSCVQKSQANVAMQCCNLSAFPFFKQCCGIWSKKGNCVRSQCLEQAMFPETTVMSTPSADKLLEQPLKWQRRFNPEENGEDIIFCFVQNNWKIRNLYNKPVSCWSLLNMCNNSYLLASIHLSKPQRFLVDDTEVKLLIDFYQKVTLQSYLKEAFLS